MQMGIDSYAKVAAYIRYNAQAGKSVRRPSSSPNSEL